MIPSWKSYWPFPLLLCQFPSYPSRYVLLQPEKQKTIEDAISKFGWIHMLHNSVVYDINICSEVHLLKMQYLTICTLDYSLLLILDFTLHQIYSVLAAIFLYIKWICRSNFTFKYRLYSINSGLPFVIFYGPSKSLWRFTKCLAKVVSNRNVSPHLLSHLNS